MGLMDEFREGVGRFGPLALPSEKKLAQAMAPALAGAMGHMDAASISGNAQQNSTAINAKGGIIQQGIRDSGETFRQRLIIDANKILEEMRQGGANYRTRYAEDSATGRNTYTQDETGRRLKKQLETGLTAQGSRLAAEERMMNLRPGQVNVQDLLGSEDIPAPVQQPATPDRKRQVSPYDPFSVIPDMFGSGS
jgi:hypothetical protein